MTYVKPHTRRINGKSISISGHYRVDKKKNYCRYRQFEPTECQRGSFRTKYVNSETKLILCRKKGQAKTSAQSILKRRHSKNCSRGK